MANDLFVKDARLYIDGHFVENFSQFDEINSIEPCISLSDNFPNISLTASPTSIGKSFYEFLIISKDYKYQQKGTKIIEDGVCQKWELETRHLSRVVNDRFDVQGMVKVSNQAMQIKVFCNEDEELSVLKIILNDEELITNYNPLKGAWEYSLNLEEGMNFIAIEYVDNGVFSEIPVTPNVELFDGNEFHSFSIQTYFGLPGAFLVACHK